jgi:hypothetical protein
MNYSLSKIKEELDTLPEYDNQLYLQGNSSNMDPIEPTKGQNYLHVDNNELEYNINLFDIPYINSIMDEHKLVRTRLMRMKKKTCYYWHKDLTKRLHIAIDTHPHCFLLVDGEQFHIPADGTPHIIDTTKMHTALNASKQDRIHIVGAFSV